MNSVLQYVRQLNQQSVTLRNEWLDRLRHVECEPGTFSLSPEIELTRKPALRSSDSTNHEAPVTVVPRSDSGTTLSKTVDDSKSNSDLDSPVIQLTAQSQGVTESTIGAPYCPMDRLRELLGEELHVHSGPFESSPKPESKAVSPAQKQVSVEAAIKKTPVAPHSFVPSPHVSIRSRKPSELHELGSTSDDDAELTPLASFPFDDESTTAADADPLQNEPLKATGIAANTIEPSTGGKEAVTAAEPANESAKTVQANRTTERSVARPVETKLDQSQSLKPRSIDKITDQLLARFPAVASSTVMFASLTPGIDVDNVAAKVATCLASRDLGGILLVDGNSRSRGLSSLMASHRSPGFSELVNRTETLSSVVCMTDNSNLEFLPYGNSDVTHRRFDATRATALGKEFNQAFQYTIVSGGVVDDTLVRQWAGYVDAVYLLIDLASADRQATIDTLTAMRHHAVRIAGFIAVEDEIRIF